MDKTLEMYDIIKFIGDCLPYNCRDHDEYFIRVSPKFQKRPTFHDVLLDGVAENDTPLYADCLLFYKYVARCSTGRNQPAKQHPFCDTLQPLTLRPAVFHYPLVQLMVACYVQLGTA